MSSPSPEKVVLTRAETMRHILTVRSLMGGCAQVLIDRGVGHDRSKLHPPESEMFAEVTERLSGLTYGSDAYKECLEEMKKGALGHHYSHNRHHPEHFSDGVVGMDLFDLLEMLCDWKAATLRHKDGDMEKSLELNAERFEIPEVFLCLLRNTAVRINQLAAEQNVAMSYPHVEAEAK